MLDMLDGLLPREYGVLALHDKFSGLYGLLCQRINMYRM